MIIWGDTDNWRRANLEMLESTNRRVVPRTQWGRVIFGLSLMLFALLLGIATFSDTSKPVESRATSRRMETLERMIGKTGVTVGTILFCISLGGYLIYESQEITTEAVNSSESQPCGLCGKSSSDTAKAFVRIIGGIVPFRGAIRCGRILKLSGFASQEIYIRIPGSSSDFRPKGASSSNSPVRRTGDSSRPRFQGPTGR